MRLAAPTARQLADALFPSPEGESRLLHGAGVFELGDDASDGVNGAAGDQVEGRCPSSASTSAVVNHVSTCAGRITRASRRMSSATASTDAGSIRPPGEASSPVGSLSSMPISRAAATASSLNANG
jgi:hypothetical protein